MRLCGIDEAGRGCLAGDLVVAGCVLVDEVEGLCDSKKLSEKAREKLYDEIRQKSSHHIVVFKPFEVDKFGLSACLKKALKEIMLHVEADEYIFDGNTTFGIDNLKSKIKADATIKEVSAASILAKVTHDTNIKKDAIKYPKYEFEKHKGYGTKRHLELIKRYGLSPIHRKSFKPKSLQGTLF